MTAFKKLTGNYCEVVDKLGLPRVFYAPSTEQEYLEAVQTDLPRTSYIHFDGTAEDVKTHLNDTTHLAGKPMSYTQGSFDGGALTDSYIKKESAYVDTIQYAAREKTDSHCFGSLRMAYIDDHGQSCGLAITYLREDPISANRAALPVGERKRPFVIAVIKNTAATPSEREATFFCHPHLVFEGLQADISCRNLSGELAHAINSKKMNVLIAGIIAGDSISLPHFEALEARLGGNHNLDDRDVKNTYLNELIRIAENHLPAHSILNGYFEMMRQRAAKDINFFKKGDFEQHLEEMLEKIIGVVLAGDSGVLDRDRAIYDMCLTFCAIHFNLQPASDEVEENARELRARRDSLSSEAEEITRAFISESELFKTLHQTHFWTKVEQVLTYEKNLKLFEEKLQTFKIQHEHTAVKFYRQAEKLLKQVKVIAGAKPFNSSYKDLVDINQILECGAKALVSPKNKENVSHLVMLSQTVSGKPSPEWKVLGATLLAFAGLTLIVAGVLACIPSGGSSLLLAVAGAVGISIAAKTSIAGLGIGLTASTGLGFFGYNCQRGLAKRVSDFSSSLEEVDGDEPGLPLQHP